MRKLGILTLFVFVLKTGAQEDKKGNIFSDAGDAAKMVIAKQKLYAGQFTAALNSYRDIERSNSNNAVVKYYIGFCYFNLMQYDKAKQNLLEAVDIKKNLKPETYLVLGKIHLREESVDKALEAFKDFKSLASAAKISDENVDLLISHCENAKRLIAAPLDVLITNLGADINSKYDDKNPCITADASKLVFTTRRPETTGSPVDEEGDGRYFENIYITSIDSATGNFAKARGISDHINTMGHDACSSISPDGSQVFIYKNDINDKESRGGNVFTSKYANGKWRVPTVLPKPIKSSYWEGGACISPDGKRLFFTSEREGGLGGSDIWMVEKINKKDWGKPVNLGAGINTAYDEAGMFLAPDGKTLFFCSNNPKSMGGYDVFRTIYDKGVWSEPVNLGYPINTPGKEGQLTISADTKYAYISSDRKGGLGESDIYKIDLKNYAILEPDGIKKTNNGLSILRGTIREGFEGYGIAEAEITIKDKSDVLVSSALTNESGEYFFPLHDGDYTITIRKKGYQDISESFNLSSSLKDTRIFEKGYLLKK